MKLENKALTYLKLKLKLTRTLKFSLDASLAAMLAAGLAPIFIFTVDFGAMRMVEMLLC